MSTRHSFYTHHDFSFAWTQMWEEMFTLRAGKGGFPGIAPDWYCFGDIVLVIRKCNKEKKP